MPETLAAWSNFFVAQASAAAALAGLVFVAVSINLARILQFPHLPRLAGETLFVFVVILFVASLGLVPQSLCAFGVELAVTGGLMSAWQTVSFLRKFKTGRQYPGFVQRSVLGLFPPLLFLVAGVLLCLGHRHGLYWLVPAILGSFASGLMGAWVLLVEILR